MPCSTTSGEPLFGHCSVGALVQCISAQVQHQGEVLIVCPAFCSTRFASNRYDTHPALSTVDAVSNSARNTTACSMMGKYPLLHVLDNMPYNVSIAVQNVSTTNAND